MKTQHIVLAFAAAGVIGAGSYGVYRLGMKRGMQLAPTAASSPISGASDKAGRKILYWHDPMAPGQRFDKPGKSPFMDMPLVPVYAEDGAGGGAVSIESRVQQNLGIRTAEVTARAMSTRMEAVGNVAFNERDTWSVQARSSGFVERLFVRAPLESVKKGQKLAEIYSPEWVAAQEEYLSVRRMQGPGSEGLLEAAHQRMRLAGMTDDQLRIVTSTGKVHPRLVILAPASGIVTELGAREGASVTSGSPLFRISGLDTVWVNAEVPEALALQLRPGTPAEVRTTALGGVVLDGKVNAILPDVNAGTRTVKARVELPNPGHRLVPGMFATVSFAPAAHAGVLTVPTEAVIATGKRSVVMVAQDGGSFAPVDVDIGMESGGQTEIRSGLRAGQRVVVSGQFLIDSEASLRGTATRMAPARVDGQPLKAPGTHHGEGKVEHIGDQELTLSHGPIPSLQWPAMTMSFKVAPAIVPKGLAAGQSIRFDLRQAREGHYEIIRIETVSADHAGHGPQPAAAPEGARQ